MPTLKIIFFYKTSLMYPQIFFLIIYFVTAHMSSNCSDGGIIASLFEECNGERIGSICHLITVQATFRYCMMVFHQYDTQTMFYSRKIRKYRY